MLKIVMTSDEDIKRCVLTKLDKQNKLYGARYCPCALQRTIDTICMCKSFREQNFPGECHCGLYEKVEIN